MRYIGEFPKGENVLGIVMFNGRPLVTTSKGVYRIKEDDTLTPLRIESWDEGEFLKCACWFCAGEMIWQSDSDNEDLGYEPGLTAFLKCSKCGASAEFTKLEEEDNAKRD